MIGDPRHVLFILGATNPTLAIEADAKGEIVAVVAYGASQLDPATSVVGMMWPIKRSRLLRLVLIAYRLAFKHACRTFLGPFVGRW